VTTSARSAACAPRAAHGQVRRGLRGHVLADHPTACGSGLGVRGGDDLSEDVQGFYRQYYAPNNAVLVLVGDFDSEKTIAQIERYFGHLKRVPPSRRNASPRSPRPSRSAASTPRRKPIRCAFRYHGVASATRTRPPWRCLANCFPGKPADSSSACHQEEAVIGQPYGYNNSRKTAGNFEVGATIKEGHKPEDVAAMILEEIRKLREGQITDYELQKVKTRCSPARWTAGEQHGTDDAVGVYDTCTSGSTSTSSLSRCLPSLPTT